MDVRRKVATVVGIGLSAGTFVATGQAMADQRFGRDSIYAQNAPAVFSNVAAAHRFNSAQTHSPTSTVTERRSGKPVHSTIASDVNERPGRS